MVAECDYRRLDSLLQNWYCRAASNDSLTGILTLSPRHMTCEDCPVPRLLWAHLCMSLELRPVIVPSEEGSIVVDLERFCQVDGIKLDHLDGCGPSCAAYRLVGPNSERVISS
jgi:hypothetical protein